MLGDLKYLMRLLVSLWRPYGPRGRMRRAVPAVVGVLGLALVAYGYVPAVSAAQRSGVPAADALKLRALEVDRALERVESAYAAEVEPMERVLRSYRDDERLAKRVAVALVREARRNDLPPRLLLAVLLVENPWLNPTASSSVGAQGLMQVMPLHRGKWKPCKPDLVDVDSNICHGARIFASYLRSEKGNLERALLRYNGCVKGTNTPNCHQYANHVFARAGRASVMAWRRPGGAGAP